MKPNQTGFRLIPSTRCEKSTTTLFLPSLFAQAQVVRYVRASGAAGAGGTSWASAGNDLQATINESAPGDEVWVAAGTYSPGVTGTSFSLKNGVTLLGGFPATGTPALQDRDWASQETILLGNGNRVIFNDATVGNTTLLDGFSVKGGSVAGNGGGMLNQGASPRIVNCLFRDNEAKTDNNLSMALGGGIYNNGGSVSLEKCVFRSNKAYSYGGAVASIGCATVMLNDCVIFGNEARVLAGGLYNQDIGTLLLTRCRLIRNSTTLLTGTSAAAIYNGNFSGIGSRIVNCLFTGNQSNVGPVMLNWKVPGLAVIHCTMTGNIPSGSSAKPKGAILNDGNVSLSITNSILNADESDTFDGLSNQGIGNSVDVSYSTVKGITTGTGNFQVYNDQLFLNPGPQSEDGNYRLRPCSYVIDRCPPVADVTTDLDGQPRVQFTAADAGAYESNTKSNPEAEPIVASSAVYYRFQRPDDIVYYYAFDVCNTLMAAIRGDGSPTAIQGLTLVHVWVDDVQPANYVRRHYQIDGGSSATARVTLYFTQSEFDSFNAVNAAKLPTGPADASGKANLRVEKRGGSSFGGTGAPSSYSGAVTLIDPADSDITWNSVAARWEVTFDVTGFSGFFIRAQEAAPLPLRLVRFSGTRKNNVSSLVWQTADERMVSHFAVERSTDGRVFESIGTVMARNSTWQAYEFDDAAVFAGARYYRLKMTDQDGSYVYSKTLSLQDEFSAVRVGPNPAGDWLTIDTQDMPAGEATITSLTGITRLRFRLTDSKQSVSVKSLPAGVYVLRLSNGHIFRFVKE